jgi:hypothetical protein
MASFLVINHLVDAHCGIRHPNFAMGDIVEGKACLWSTSIPHMPDFSSLMFLSDKAGSDCLVVDSAS